MDNDNSKPQQANFYRNICYLADLGGTGWWRRIAPLTLLNQFARQANMLNTYAIAPVVGEARYYVGVNSVTIQRWITDQQREIVEKFFVPLFQQTGTKLIYEIDDAMHYEDIPLFNSGREPFANDKVQENIKYMLNASYLVTVTTDYIKEYYHKRYGIPLEKIVAIPNLLPRIWYGDRYRPNEKLAQFQQFKSKPRIGVIGSLSHYNYKNILDENGNAVPDDISPIIDLVKETVDDFQWVFFGAAPFQLKELCESKKIECHSTVPILMYPSAIQHLCLQAVVAPLQDIEFNRCKSFIKYQECAALGIPLFAQNMLPYNRVMPPNQLFSNQSELKEKLMKLKFSSNGAYGKMIEQQWKWLNSPAKEGNTTLVNYWMDDNVGGIWGKLFRLPLGFVQKAEEKQ